VIDESAIDDAEAAIDDAIDEAAIVGQASVPAS
jgi:hypothetical protein